MSSGPGLVRLLGGRLLGSEPAAVAELGGERGLAQPLPGHGGDPRDVGAVAGLEAVTGKAPGRVRRSEQPGGPVMLTAECLCAGQAGKRLCHRMRVTEFLRGGQAFQMP